MKRIAILACALALVSVSCDNLPFLGGKEERTVLVDYSHDEFASFFLLNFPKRVEVTPGTTVVFRQTWTGEPHTVTGGTSVNESLQNPLLKFVTAFESLAGAGVRLPNPEGDIPPGTTVRDVIDIVEKAPKSPERTDFLESYDKLADDKDLEFPSRDRADEVSFAKFVQSVDPKVEEAFGSVAFAFDEESGDITQNYGRPCFLDRGLPPKDSDNACPKKEQPAFDGTQSFYSSGIIPYEGAQGNTFNVPLADDIKPGNYTFYCAVHGPGQSTELVVRPAGTDVPSQEEVSREARKEIDMGANVLEKVYKSAVDKNEIRVLGQRIKGPFAGLFSDEYDHALINEFVPKNLTVRRDEPFHMKMMGAAHTVSFGVPRYFPIVQFLDNGRIRYNPRLRTTAGGAKKPPEESEGPPPEGPPPPTKYDAGTYDGTGFWSTGLVGGDSYVDLTFRISKPGTYDFACLIHPPMVGKIKVT